MIMEEFEERRRRRMMLTPREWCDQISKMLYHMKKGEGIGVEISFSRERIGMGILSTGDGIGHERGLNCPNRFHNRLIDILLLFPRSANFLHNTVSYSIITFFMSSILKFRIRK